MKGDNEAQTSGIKIVYNALLSPAKQIAQNAGVEGAVVANKVLENKDNNYGYDAQNDTFGDMLKAGIVDPTKVARIALEGASSISSLLLTTECAIVEKKEDNGSCSCGNGGAGMPSGMGGMGDF